MELELVQGSPHQSCRFALLKHYMVIVSCQPSEVRHSFPFLYLFPVFSRRENSSDQLLVVPRGENHVGQVLARGRFVFGDCSDGFGEGLMES